jgi:glycine hydroxymethyltransferase
VTGGTDTHLLLVDLRNKGLTGKAAEAALGLAGIHVNKNAVPNDPQSPFVTSGIRIGTPALTTRGMGEAEMRSIAALVDAVLAAPDREEVRRATAAEVRELTAAYPLYAVQPAAP